MSNNHFAAIVPLAVQNKLMAIALLAKQEYISRNNGAYGCESMQPISGVHYDGFIPYQNGGYEVTELYQNDIDRGYHWTLEQSNYMEKLENNCLSEFCQANNIANVNDIPHEMADILADFEADWYDPALLRFECWITQDEKVMLRLSINYKDAPYYRSGDDETIQETMLTVDEFMNSSNESLLNEIIK